MFEITPDPIDVARVRRAVDSPRFGAVLVFEGVARDDGGVTHLSYEAYPEMAVPVMREIAAELQDRWPGTAVAMVHRTGAVGIGEPSVVIAVGAPHRAECYEASRFAIDALKARVPVWKKEHTVQGSAWKPNTHAADAGRPTPQKHHDPASPAAEGAERRPRFEDRPPEEHRRPDVNPYLILHRELGHPLIPASDAWTWRGRWHELFGRRAPLHLEIGSGNGFFLSGYAKLHPEIDLVGIEIRYKRVVQCARKLVGAGVDNAVIARYHAGFLDDLFEEGSLAAIHVNHPDPWPKEKHEKNRLISRWFLEDVCRFLQPGGALRIKSDFAPNVDRVAELLDRDGEGNPRPRLPLDIVGHSADVNGKGAPWPDDVVTNYQTKMKHKGHPVHALHVVRRAD